MTYCDISFLGVFLPITIILYSICPTKKRPIVLLIASYIFFWSISGKLIVYLIASTLIIYLFSMIAKLNYKKRDEKLKTVEKDLKKETKLEYSNKLRKILILCILIQIGILIVLKYSGFIGNNINSLLKAINIPIDLNIKNFIVPIGISFYTLQAVSYMVDVYKEVIIPDTNIGRLALYLSFFPQIMEGPICRYRDTAEKLWSGNKITYKSLIYGIQRILFGLMKKMIIADRLDIIVSNIFENYSQYNGGIIASGMIFYTLQLYMDFSGVMDIVIGIGEIFGVRLSENFKQPFLSKSVSEFWTRWHITLGAWFRDYIYYPVSMSKFGKKLLTKSKKKLGNYYGPLMTSIVALFIVWICNGIWHGSAWNYIFFGLYHFTLILIERLTEPITKKIIKKLKINTANIIYSSIQIIKTTILVFFGELFFRANGLKAGFYMFGKIFTNFSINGNVLKLGLDSKDFIIITIFTIIIFITSIMKEKNINIRDEIGKKNIIIRWSIYYAVILSIIIFGAYGKGYIPVNPMYAQF